jgi:DNA-binding IclR family transcriptional regulator
VLRYLAVAHFGRGRGNFVEGEVPAFWQAEVERAVSLHADAVGKLWHAARADADIDAAIARIDAVFSKIVAHTLGRLYPGAAPAV